MWGAKNFFSRVVNGVALQRKLFALVFFPLIVGSGFSQSSFAQTCTVSGSGSSLVVTSNGCTGSTGAIGCTYEATSTACFCDVSSNTPNYLSMNPNPSTGVCNLSATCIYYGQQTTCQTDGNNCSAGQYSCFGDFTGCSGTDRSVSPPTTSCTGSGSGNVHNGSAVCPDRGTSCTLCNTSGVSGSPACIPDGTLCELSSLGSSEGACSNYTQVSVPSSCGRCCSSSVTFTDSGSGGGRGGPGQASGTGATLNFVCGGGSPSTPTPTPSCVARSCTCGPPPGPFNYTGTSFSQYYSDSCGNSVCYYSDNAKLENWTGGVQNDCDAYRATTYANEVSSNCQEVFPASGSAMNQTSGQGPYGGTYCTFDPTCQPLASNANCYACMLTWYISDNANFCGGTPTPTPANVGVTPTPVYSPTPTATPSCLDTGGNGRLCTQAPDCCSGFSCVVAGDQPVQTTSTTFLGVNWLSGFSGSGSDVLTSGMTFPAGTAVNGGPTKMCVDATHLPSWGSTASPLASPSPTYLPVSAQASALGAAIDSTLLSWKNNAYFFCNLQDNDNHRQATGCSCSAGYEPFVVWKTQFNLANYNLHMGNHYLDSMWADIVDLLQKHKEVQKDISKTFARVSKLIPNASAYIPGTPSPLYVDSGSWSPVVTGYRPWLATPVPYGILNTPGSNSADVSQVDSLHEIECVKQCPKDSQAPIRWTTIHDAGDGTSAPTCDCVDQTGSTTWTYDSVNNTCTSVCPVGSTIINGACQCPFNYENFSGNCRPKMPSAEYIHNANGYPVCSQGAAVYNSRLPVTYGLQISSASAAGVPNLGDVTNIPGNLIPFPYSDPLVKGSTIYPGYAYASLQHCACTGYTVGAASPLPMGTPTLGGGVNNDTLDAIAAFDSNGLPTKSFGMVAASTSTTGSGDGRLGAGFGTSSDCACPNVNEYPVLSGKTVTCAPVIPSTDPNKIFTTYNVGVDNYPGESEVFTLTSNVSGLAGIVPGYTELVDSSNAVLPTISLPTNQSSPNVLATYTRHIWKCQMGYLLDLSQTPPVCKWASTHACDDGSISGAGHSSPVGTDPATKTEYSFDNIINKKLACCLNNQDGSTHTSADVKFDCLDNTTASAGSFDALWASSDSKTDGGQMNAILLASANGKPLTGFYTLDGARCNDLSEFDPAGIQPGVLNPLAANTASQQNLAGGSGDVFTATGTLISAPTTSLGYTSLLAGLKVKTAPHPGTSSIENLKARRCPVLVRAAMIASCPPYIAPTIPPTNVVFNTVKDANGNLRCPTAESIKVHVRVEQVFQIAGTPPLETIDTILDHNTANTISVETLLRQKPGGLCPPGETATSGGCTYIR